MQRTLHGVDWNELNDVPCEILRTSDAHNKLIELGLDIIKELQLAFKLSNNAYAIRNKKNPGRAMGRWGDICEHADTILEPCGWSLIRKNGQPCLVNSEKNLQLIFMSPNDEAFGNELNVITSKCHKGHSTELKLLANKSHYSDANFFRTFIVYYQPSNLIDLENSDFLPFEIAYATGVYKVSTQGEKTKCYPSNHTLRMIMSDSPDAPEAYEVPIPDENNPITEDDFGDLQAI